MFRKKLKYGAKADFIRANPGTTVDEVIARAALQGMDLEREHVRKVRSKQSGEVPKVIKIVAVKQRAVKPRSRPLDDSIPLPKVKGLEEAFVRILSEIGLIRGRAILDEAESIFNIQAKAY